MISSFRKLKGLGVLGNNMRIRDFILPYNKRSHYPLVDDKYRSSLLLDKAGIPHPRTIGIIDSVSGMRGLHEQLKLATEFVVKPVKGAMGNGIVIVESVTWAENKKDTILVTTRQDNMRYDDFTYYISQILSGVFSLGGQQDRALFQEKLKIHPFFKGISHRGIPDIRIILFRGYPVMAMTRLPTQESGGRGNLHQGAVGCGIDLPTGITNGAMQNNRLIDRHPDIEDQELVGLQIPEWEQVLSVASQCAEVFPVEYMGVDVVIDPVRGPLVLEINARPGLSIQIANQKGLVPALNKVASLKSLHETPQEKVLFSLQNL